MRASIVLSLLSLSPAALAQYGGEAPAAVQPAAAPSPAPQPFASPPPAAPAPAAVPLVVGQTTTVAVAESGTRRGFLLSARLVGSGSAFYGEGGAFSLAKAMTPFVVGFQFGRLGLGAGLGYQKYSSSATETETYYDGYADVTETATYERDRSLLTIGPTVSYQILESGGGAAQLHLFGTAVLGTGSGTDSESAGGDSQSQRVDLSSFGFDAGLFGRGFVTDAVALEAGLAIDYLGVTEDGQDRKDEDASTQIVGFLGATFVIG
jgi:hypothetical protein